MKGKKRTRAEYQELLFKAIGANEDTESEEGEREEDAGDYGDALLDRLAEKVEERRGREEREAAMEIEYAASVIGKAIDAGDVQSQFVFVDPEDPEVSSFEHEGRTIYQVPTDAFGRQMVASFNEQQGQVLAGMQALAKAIEAIDERLEEISDQTMGTFVAVNKAAENRGSVDYDAVRRLGTTPASIGSGMVASAGGYSRDNGASDNGGGASADEVERLARITPNQAKTIIGKAIADGGDPKIDPIGIELVYDKANATKDINVLRNLPAATRAALLKGV